MHKHLAQYIYSEYHEIYTTSGYLNFVNKTAGTIEINGNRYDAVSGQLIGAAKNAAKHITRPIDGLNMDGFSKPVRAAKKSAIGRSVHNLQRKPEKSKTLMRAAVKKPARRESPSKIKTRRFMPDYARAARAAQVRQDSKVQRFGRLGISKAKAEPKAKSGELLPKGAHLSTGSSASVSASLPSMNTTSHQKLERLLDYALASADAHKKAIAHSKRSKFLGHTPKWAKVSLVIVILAAGVGLLLWQKMPVASMKLAATRAHINATLPTPLSGYKIGPITSREHAVTTTVQSSTDSSKKYTVTEQSSNQPANSLEASTSGQVQKVQDQDKTYVLSQKQGSNEAACTKGNNTVSVSGVGLNVAELLEAAKNACKS